MKCIITWFKYRLVRYITPPSPLTGAHGPSVPWPSLRTGWCDIACQPVLKPLIPDPEQFLQNLRIFPGFKDVWEPCVICFMCPSIESLWNKQRCTPFVICYKVMYPLSLMTKDLQVRALHGLEIRTSTYPAGVKPQPTKLNITQVGNPWQCVQIRLTGWTGPDFHVQ